MIARAPLAALLAMLALGLGLRGFMNRTAQNRLQPGEEVDIARLRAPLPQPSFLSCPPGYCDGKAAASPEFSLPWQQLRDAWRRMMAEEPRVVELRDEPRQRRIVYVVHTRLLAFPDIVTIEFVPLAADRSSIALFSRARYGRYDFGKNRERGEHWLRELQRRVRARDGKSSRADR